MKLKLLLLTAFLLSGCAALAPKNDNGYPPKVVENIVSGCEKTSAVPKICPCMAEKVQKKYSYEEFVKIDKAIASGKTPADFQKFAGEAAKECAIN